IFASYEGDLIVCHRAYSPKGTNLWAPFGKFAIPRKGAIFDRTKKEVTIAVKYSDPENTEPHGVGHDAEVLMCFLNALACSNVRIERSDPKKGAQKTKSALQFDAYHVLTVDFHESKTPNSCKSVCDRRSPREHIRRGHIRRIENGRKIWISAAVVGSTNGAGVINKDYKIAPQ
ncbi:MAG: hypothetical protein ACKO0Z_16885, partial [Betaproteobacteria bacterium]